MSKRIIDTVRKLLRLARRAETRAEAENARARANELMDKYNLHLQLDDSEDYRIEVVGVSGTYWREELLDALCRANECCLLKNEQTKRTFVTGYASDAKRAVDLYKAAQSELIVRGLVLFADELENSSEDDVAGGWSIGADGAPKRRESRADKLMESRSAWLRVYLYAASEELRKRLLQSEVVKPKPSPASFAGFGVDEDRKRQDDEIAKVSDARDKLTERMGKEGAKYFLREAMNAGRRVVDKIRLRATAQLFLTANSSWLPKPTRFSKLDYGEEIPATPTAPVRKQRLDLDDEPTVPATGKRRGRLDLD